MHFLSLDARLAQPPPPEHVYGNFRSVRLAFVLYFKNIVEKAKISNFLSKCQYLQNLRNIIVEKKHGQNHIYLLKIWEETL